MTNKLMSGREQAQESERQLGKAPSGNEALSTGLAGLESAVVNLGLEKAGIHEGKAPGPHSGNLTLLWAWLLPAPPGLPLQNTLSVPVPCRQTPHLVWKELSREGLPFFFFFSFSPFSFFLLINV